MRFSEDRISHISHLILDELTGKSFIETDGNPAVLNDIKRTFFKYLQVEDEVDDMVRKKIRSYSRVIAEGSREWDVMYDKLFGEEMAKKGFTS